jgi:hypothetical protein
VPVIIASKCTSRNIRNKGMFAVELRERNNGEIKQIWPSCVYYLRNFVPLERVVGKYIEDTMAVFTKRVITEGPYGDYNNPTRPVWSQMINIMASGSAQEN